MTLFGHWVALECGITERRQQKRGWQKDKKKHDKACKKITGKGQNKYAKNMAAYYRCNLMIIINCTERESTDMAPLWHCRRDETRRDEKRRCTWGQGRFHTISTHIHKLQQRSLKSLQTFQPIKKWLTYSGISEAPLTKARLTFSQKTFQC